MSERLTPPSDTPLTPPDRGPDTWPDTPLTPGANWDVLRGLQPARGLLGLLRCRSASARALLADPPEQPPSSHRAEADLRSSRPSRSRAEGHTPRNHPGQRPLCPGHPPDEIGVRADTFRPHSALCPPRVPGQTGRCPGSVRPLSGPHSRTCAHTAHRASPGGRACAGPAQNGRTPGTCPARPRQPPGGKRQRAAGPPGLRRGPAALMPGLRRVRSAVTSREIRRATSREPPPSEPLVGPDLTAK